MRADILVVGGGPAGAAAAIVLARAGRDVIVTEKAAFPRRKVCGEFVAGAGISLLGELGLKRQFDALAGPEIRSISLWTRNRSLEAPMPANVQYPRALEREQLDALLLGEARRSGARVLQPCGDEAEVEARTVIRACGSWRRGEELSPSDLFGFQAHFSEAALPAHTIVLVPFPGGYAGLVERAQAQATFACCVRRDQLTRIRATGISAGEAVLRYAMAACAPLRQALASAEREGPWMAAGPLHPGKRPAYEAGIFAIGNASSEAHPVVGEGIAMAMQSGALLAHALLEHATHQEAAAAYVHAWRRFTPRLRASSLFATLAMSPIAPALGGLLSAVPGLLTAAARISGKSLASRAAAVG